MRKCFACLLALSLLLCALPASAEPGAALRPVENLIGPDTVVEVRHMFTATPEWLASMGVTLDDLSTLGDAGLETETSEMSLSAGMQESEDLRILSVSPDGETFLYEYNGIPVLLKDGRLTMASMDITRCGMSEQHGLKDSVYFMQSAVLHKPGIGRAGVQWSPDGRFALLGNSTATLQRLHDFYGLTWLDTETAQVYMAIPGMELKPGRGDAGVLLQQVYAGSADGNVYCTVYMNSDSEYRTMIRRYPFGSAEGEDLAGIMETMCCEGMGTDGNGNLVFAIQSGKDRTWFNYNPADGTCKADKIPEWLVPVMVYATPACTMLTSVVNDPDELKLLLLRTENGFSRLVIDAGADAARTIPADPGTKAQAEGLELLQASLSADGTRALVCCMDAEGPVLYLLDTEILALTPVDISSLGDRIAEKGTGFVFTNNLYLPGTHFTGGDRYVIVPFGDGSTVLCELVFE